MKGRPKDPTRARRQTGHRRKPGEAPKLAIVAAPPEVVQLEPPPDLPEAMRPTWDRMVELLVPLGTRPVDAFTVEALVRQYHRMRSTGALVDEYGVVLRTEGGAVSASPFLKAERDAAAMFLRIGEQFGLTVASRMRLGLMQLQGKTMAQALSEDLEEG